MCVQVQNQAGPHKNKWEVSGTVVEVLGHEAYNVKMDGSGRVSRRHRGFLRPIVPYSDVVSGRVSVRGPQELERAPIKDNLCTPASRIVDITDDNDSNNIVQGVEIHRTGGQGLVPGADFDMDARGLGGVPGGATGGAPVEVDTSPVEAQDVTHALRRSTRVRFQPEFFYNRGTINAMGGGVVECQRQVLSPTSPKCVERVERVDSRCGACGAGWGCATNSATNATNQPTSIRGLSLDQDGPQGVRLAQCGASLWTSCP